VEERSVIPPEVRLAIVEAERRVLHEFEDWRHNTFAPLIADIQRENILSVRSAVAADAVAREMRDDVAHLTGAVFGNGKPGLRDEFIKLKTVLRVIGVAIIFLQPVLVALIVKLLNRIGFP
jgi:hypothetical protein